MLNAEDVHREQLVHDQGQRGWTNAIIDEIEDVVVELNGKYQDQWIFENETGIFNGPNGEEYTGKGTIRSVE